MEYKAMTPIFYLKSSVAVAVVGLIVTGCAVGPDFRTPEAPSTSKYTTTAVLQPETAAVPTAGQIVQHLEPGQEIPAQWWTLFRSEALEQLIGQALANNPTLDAAKATLRQSQEELRAGVGSALLPRVDANASASREKISGAAFGQPENTFSPFTLYNASVNVSYALDLFGGARRELEVLRSQVDYQRFQLEGAYLALTSNIVTAAVKEASLRAQIKAMKEILAAQSKQLDVIQQQFQLGAVALPDVLAQQTQVAQTRAALLPLEKELAQNRHQLSTLAGRLPSESSAMPEFDLEGLSLPEELPVSLPSSLVRQRPDIRAAEALLHAASAQVGVATANLYPQVTLSGAYGSEAASLNTLFTGSTAVWNLGAGLLQPLFRGGELTAKRRAAIAAFDQAAAQYRSVVLQAFQNVADVLLALDADSGILTAQAVAEKAARDSFDLTQKQFQLGSVSYLTLLNAERQYQQARIGLIQAQAVRFADTAALFQALGGGWWNRSPEADRPAPMKKD
jgi:NodT family efflux transporter outer membrane factor (OMF) lipoprotein